jgi:hypothetical protein
MPRLILNVLALTWDLPVARQNSIQAQYMLCLTVKARDRAQVMDWSDDDAKGMEIVIGREEELARHRSDAIAKTSGTGFSLECAQRASTELHAARL